MSRDELMLVLQDISKKTNEEWLSELDERKKLELEFHNQHRDLAIVQEVQTHNDTYEKFYGNKKYYQTVRLSTEYVDNWIKTHSPGKIVLDYACGNGQNAIKAAKSGASLAIGLDISDISVKNAANFANEQGLSETTYFLQGDCENTGLPNDCIDVITCTGMLHHLDLKYALS